MTPRSTSRRARIVSTGRFLPTREVTNDVLRRRFAHLGAEMGAEMGDVVDELETATGIRRRFYAPEDWATSDLALPAAQQALERAGLSADEIDLLILCTDTPDYLTPATSTVLQHKLGASRAGTFDIGCACASFPTGLTTAAGWIQANPATRRVLVVGAYLMQRLADPDDPTIFFYGDGAGAALLEAHEDADGDDDAGFIAAAAQADGAYAERWGIFAGGTKEPASKEALEAGRMQVRLVERYPPDVNHTGWPRLVRRLARDGGFGVQNIDLVIFTQVRRPSVEHVMGLLDLPMERTHTIMEEWGYTGSACLAMAFDDALAQGKAKAGDLVVFIGSGVGYNQAGVAFRL